MKNLQTARLPELADDTAPASSDRKINAQERRRQILAAATAVFSEKGYSGATTREISLRAKINEALIFRYFGDKNALYEAIIEQYNGKIDESEMLHKLAAVAATKDDMQVFINAGEFIAGRLLVDRQKSERAYLRMMVYGILEKRPKAAKMLEKQLRPLQNFLVNYIRERQREKAFRQVDALSTVDAFFGMTIHHMLMGEMFCRCSFYRNDNEAVVVFARIVLADLSNNCL